MSVDSISAVGMHAFPDLQDVVPYEASLDRLLRARVCSAEQLYDFELNQALRGLFAAVKDHRRRFTLASGATASPAPHTHSSRTTDGRPLIPPAERVLGREAVLYRMCTLLTVSLVHMPTLVYLSMRLLSDAASALGEGNARPCCTPEWSEALTALATMRGAAPHPSSREDDGGDHDGAPPTASPAFSQRIVVDRRFQLGYLYLVAGTLRSVASGSVQGRSLFTHFLPLARTLVVEVLPVAAMLAEGKSDAIASTEALRLNQGWGSPSSVPQAPSATQADDSVAGAPGPDKATGSRDGPPSRLTVEANHFILHTTYWLCVDATRVHLGADRTAPVLDREVPQQLWSNVTRVRAAMARAMDWLRTELTQRLRAMRHAHTAVAASSTHVTARAVGDPTPAVDNVTGTAQAVGAGGSAGGGRGGGSAGWALLEPEPALSLLDAVRRHVAESLSEALETHERLRYARHSAATRYGESAKDVHAVDEALWRATLRLCLQLESVTGAWVAVQGGLGLGTSTTGVVLVTLRDVLLYVASGVSRVPSPGGAGHGEAAGESGVAAATDGLLSAAVAVAAVAPLSPMQFDLWRCHDGAVTPDIQAALAQRGLRFRNERVLQLTALLMNSILCAQPVASSAGARAAGAGATALVAAETAEQLLEMLSSDRDATSHVVIDLLTTATAQRPHTLVPALFRLLRHGGAQARRNALDVLAGLPSLRRSAADVGVGTGAGEGRLREVLRLLAEQLLMQLHDTELVTRMQGAALFARVWPADVLYPLLNLCTQRDTGAAAQSAARAALTSVVGAHLDNADVVLLLLQEAYALLTQWDRAGHAPHYSALGQAVTETAAGAESSSLSSARAPAPTTPGDLLSRAALYGTEAVGAGTTPAGSDPDTDADGGDGGPGPAPTALAKRRVARLHGLLASLLAGWVDEVRCAPSGATSAAHVMPLLLFLRAVGDAAAQPFYVRHVTGLLSALTAEEKVSDGDTVSGPRGEDGRFVRRSGTHGQRAVLDALFRVFFAEEPDRAPSGEAACSDAVAPPRSLCRSDQGSSLRWIDAAHAMATADVEKPSDQALYDILLPLLCLRSCHRGILASLAPVREDEEDAHARTEVVCAVENACALPDVDVSEARIARAVYGDVTKALFDEPYRAFFSRHSELQRVLLEAACKASPRMLLDHRDARRHALSGDESDDETVVFLHRVTVFSVSLYVSSVGWESEVDRMLPRLADAVLAAFQYIVGVCEPGGHSSAGMPGKPASALPPRAAATLRSATLDAVALLTLRSLASSRSEAARRCIATASVKPLQDLIAAFETFTKGGTEASPTSDAQLLEQARDASLELIVDTQLHMLRVVQAHPKAATLLGLWVAQYLPLLVRLANLAGKHEPPPMPTAVACGEIVFRAVLLCAKVSEPSAVSPPTEGRGGVTVPAVSLTADTAPLAGGRGEAPSPLPRIFTEEGTRAVASFGLGCSRFKRSLPLQQVGIRILAALLGAAPDVFLTPNAEPTIDEVFAVMGAAAAMHEDVVTRRLAEQVLQAFPGAAGH